MANSSFFTASGVSTKVINDLDTITEEAKAYKDAAAVSAAEAATDAAIIKADINTAVSSASSAQLSAAEAANSAADTIGREVASEASAVASEASSVASAASAVASEASKVTAVASAVGATASELAAGTSASTASTKASEASTSATNAAASASNAATSDTGAAAQATIATTKASEALTSADNSALSASASASSAVTSAAEATSAASSATASASSATASATSATESAVSAASIVGDVADAQAAATETFGYRDTASLHKLAAEAAATSATNTAAALVGFDLEAIAASKAVTAKDVFVYDTSKDSDGGAWRKRTQGTSWYQETLNTATRGSRREFPSVAVIVAEALKVTIYDGDDPALPMWMVFAVTGSTGNSTWLGRTNITFSSVTMKDGLLAFGSNGLGDARGLHLAYFTSDGLAKIGDNISYLSGFAQGFGLVDRNLGSTTVNGTASTIINRTVNDVAMTVLPDAPIDPATGLPVPTIAVATDGGVSVIKDDGDVWDITNSHGTINKVFDVAFVGSTLFFSQGYRSGNSYPTMKVIRDISTLTSDTEIAQGGTAGTGIDLDALYDVSDLGPNAALPNTQNWYASQPTSGSSFVYAFEHGGGSIISIRKEDTTTPADGMVTFINSDYNTGWMNGDTKGAFLSDTDTASLVGTELVTNGTFDADLTGWTGAGWTWDASGAARGIAGSVPGHLSQGTPIRAGSTYQVNFDVVDFGGGDAWAIQVRVWSNANMTGSLYVNKYYYTYGVGQVVTFTSPNDGYFGFNSVKTLGEHGLDNISLIELDADRSVNANPLNINGTITRTPVATGAELVAYSGFSATNYLEQPYNADLDFGTGDFSVMGWLKHSDIASNEIFRRSDPAFAGAYFRLYQSSTGVVARTSGRILTSTLAVNSGTWRQAAVVRRNGVLELWLDGSLNISEADTSDLTNASATFCLGNRQGGGDAYANGSLALWRISATAPTAEQIAKIYNDEKVLFQENAACTLYGTSDGVTALAHDSDTDLLHVGTSQGRSVFDGLRRVTNTTTAVGTAISASNGLVVEE